VTSTASGLPLGAVLVERLSRQRMAPYVRAAGGIPAGLALYRWNVTASAAFYEDLATLEVVLRNALDKQLQAWHDLKFQHGEWWDDPGGVLEADRLGDVADAKRRLLGARPDHGRVLAEINFGFWRYLLSRRYEQDLWTPALRHAFPHLRPATRAAVGDRVQVLNRFRNRIAHLEPIHQLTLEERQADIIFVVEAICPDTAAWIRRTSRVGTVLETRP
jgi:hypothetical protein